MAGTERVSDACCVPRPAPPRRSSRSAPRAGRWSAVTRSGSNCPGTWPRRVTAAPGERGRATARRRRALPGLAVDGLSMDGRSRDLNRPNSRAAHDLRVLARGVDAARRSPPGFRGTPPSSAATRSLPRCRRCRSTRDAPGARYATSPTARGPARTPSPRSSRGRSSTSSVGARWLAPARSPTSLLRERRRHAAVDRPAARDLALDRGRRAGRELLPPPARARVDRPVGDLDGDGFVEYLAPRTKDSSTRGGRTRVTACRSPTAASRSRRSRSWRCRGTSTTRRCRMAEMYQ